MSSGKKNQISIPSFLKQVQEARAKMVDESAAEAAITVLKSRKARNAMVARMKELAGGNRSQGARELRIIAENLLHDDPVGTFRDEYDLNPVEV